MCEMMIYLVFFFVSTGGLAAAIQKCNDKSFNLIVGFPPPPQATQKNQKIKPKLRSTAYVGKDDRSRFFFASTGALAAA
jgi:hypothetical protein